MPEENQSLEPTWQPIGTTERRVLGVLVEKAKTTPDAYPLTINAITTGSNQKSNRSPLLKLDAIDVENALENLRRLGAVSEVHGSGRAPKYRHRLYEWMGVEKQEAAVMTELLLRGEQTIGELRGRAARMGKISDVAELRPLLSSLIEKGLVQALTPAGRGQIVTHCLYLPEQQEKLNRNYGTGSDSPRFDLGSESADGDTVHSSPADQLESQPSQPVRTGDDSASASELLSRIDQLQSQVESLQDIVSKLENRLENLEQMIN